MSFVHHWDPHATPAATDLCLVVQADRLLAAPEISAVVSLPEFAQVADGVTARDRPLHVGTIDGKICWALGIDEAEHPAPSPWQWHDTRALLGVFSPEQSQAISCARQLLWWERRHRFCGVCGAATVTVTTERARRCPKCGALFFPVVSPAVIVAVTRGDEILLAHNRNFRPGLFSLLAGFVDPGETLEQAAAREVREETGLHIGPPRYVTSQPWSFPNSLMAGFRAECVSGELAVDGKEIEQAGWFPATALPEIPRPGTIARLLIEQWRSEH